MGGAEEVGRGLLSNFIKFSIGFSLTHAAVNTVLAFSSTLLGSELGSYGSSVLYIVYSASTLFLSRIAVRYCGAKWTVLFGLCGLQVYVLAFFVAILFPVTKWFVFISGAMVGGCGAGMLWVGQSTYYALNAAAYAKEVPSTDNYTSISNFAGYFAFFYLIFEVLLQLVALSVSFVDISDHLWQIIAFGTCAASAVLGSLIMATVKDLHQQSSSRSSKDDDDDDSPFRGNVHNFTYLPLWELLTNRKLALFVPFQICFGLSSGLINYYVNKFVVAETYGDGYVGLVMAVDTLASAVAVYPITHFSNLFRNKSFSIYLGCLIYFLNASLLISLPNSKVAKWEYLIPLFVSHGVSRCIWEGVNKALVSEYFVDIKENAFTAIYFWSGLSAGVSFFTYQYISKFYLALLNMAWSAIAILCFYFLHSKYPPGDVSIDVDVSPFAPCLGAEAFPDSPLSSSSVGARREGSREPFLNSEKYSSK
jgi:MFS family permease